MTAISERRAACAKTLFGRSVDQPHPPFLGETLI
jgi:hypothetical protein